MKLRTKLFLAFLIITFLPVVAFAVIGLLMSRMSFDIWQAVLLFGTTLIVTALVLSFWIYRSFIRPVSELKKATKEISEGNLDYELSVRCKDEIGELCDDFEAMRKRLKETAEEKTRIDSENRLLISNISHDLKTPLSSIIGYAGGLIDGVADTPEKQSKYVRTIYNKAVDMNSLIEELTLYSKIDTNRIPYNFVKLDISRFLIGYCEELRLDLESQGIDLKVVDEIGQGIYVIGDEEQLRRVLNNIISNSVKYMDKPRGIMNIRLRDADDFVQVEIEDNGRGIAKKDVPYIFDRFYRADASRNSSTGGSGIGLSIVKKIIEDHGGRIWATSEETIGTVMHFVLRKTNYE